MATRLRYSQLDISGETAVVGYFNSSDNCLLSDPTVSLTERTEGTVRILTVNHGIIQALINGNVVTVPAGSIDFNTTDISPTTFYFVINSSGFPQIITTLPDESYVVILSVRFKSQLGVITYYFVNALNNSVHKEVRKFQQRFYLERPKYIGGFLPITIDNNGYISTGSDGIVVWGNETFVVPPITNGKILLDNDTVIDKLTDITTYIDDTTIPDGAVVGIYVGINMGGVDIGVPFVAARMMNVYYSSVEECSKDRFGAIRKGMGQVYFNVTLPMCLFIFRKGYPSDRGINFILYKEYANETLMISSDSIFEPYIIKSFHDDFETAHPELSYETITNKTAYIGQTKSCIELTLSGRDINDYGGIVPSIEAYGDYNNSEISAHFKLDNNVYSIPLIGWVDPNNPLSNHLIISVYSGYFMVQRNGVFIGNSSTIAFQYGRNYLMHLSVKDGKMTTVVCDYSTGDLSNREIFNENVSIQIDTSNNYTALVGIMNYATNSLDPIFLCDYLTFSRPRKAV